MIDYVKWAAMASAALMAFGCASQPHGGPGPDRAAAAPGVNQASRLLRQARDFQARDGCVKAAPVYRIVSSYGEDYDVAQFELGACLLEMTGASDQETALFRQEALFWLNRAAWAGNPRAQGKLAEVLSGAPRYGATQVEADPHQAVVWSIIYDGNSIRDTYGLKPTPALVSAHLQSALSPEQLERARQEASGFRRIVMDAFEPRAQMEDRAEQDFRRGSGRPGRDKRPR